MGLAVFQQVLAAPSPPQQHPPLPLPPQGKAGLPSAPRVWLSAPPPGSRCASRLPSWPRVLPALPYPPASSARVRFSELDSLMPRHELVVPRCSHTLHDSQKAACQGHVASYPKPASYVMGAWSVPSKRESVSPASKTSWVISTCFLSGCTESGSA